MKRTLAGAVLGAGLLAAAGLRADDEAASAILGLKHDRAGDATRIILESSGPLVYTYYSPDPLTMVVDLPDVDATKVEPQTAVKTGEVDSVHVSTIARGDGRSLTRIEVKLVKASSYQIYAEGASLNLVFQEAEGLIPVVTALTAVSNDAPGVAAPATPAPGAPLPATPAPAPPAAPAPPPTPAAASPAPVPKPAPATTPPATPAPSTPSSKRAPVAQKIAAVPSAAIVDTPAVRVTEPLAGTATKIVTLSHKIENGELLITLRADGRLEYNHFLLDGPDRIVVDLPAVKALRRTIAVNGGVVWRLRMAQFSPEPKVGRLVVDLVAPTTYDIEEQTDGLLIRIPLAPKRSDAGAGVAVAHGFVFQ